MPMKKKMQFFNQTSLLKQSNNIVMLYYIVLGIKASKH